MWKAFGVCTECHFSAGLADMIPESAATPMFQKGIGLAGAGSLAKSLSAGAKSEVPKIAGSMPKLGSSGSSFSESMILLVMDGADPRKLVSEFYEDLDRDIERSSSDTSPSGAPLDPQKIQAGMHIGIRGPRHNGFHTVDSVDGGMITMKCEDGHMVTIPLSTLRDHEVVHALANV